MRLRKIIDWADPLQMAAGIADAEEKWTLLYSGIKYEFTGQFSILALRASEEVTSADFDELEHRLSKNNAALENAWFGYLGYGLKDCLEELPEDKPSHIDMPDLHMVNYRLILLFNHDEKNVEIWSESEEDLQHVPSRKPAAECAVKISGLKSNMSKAEYLGKVKAIKEAIARGDLYQANMTRKFNGKISTNSHFDIFYSLCQVSPSPYSAFLKFGDKFIISSSPERFLHINDAGKADTRPIKGSAQRFSDKNKDEESRKNLINSEKDRAENLMIVDLCRNDLSRGCVTGSVKTENLFSITSYATVHHMASTVLGNKRRDISSLELVKDCFPPGSMTGAPKIKAMQICTQLEEIKRGIYAGSIGWFGGDGSADLSVVIRTLIIDGDNFEFQVGGAIVADSTPEEEWRETLVKAKAIAITLGIDISELERL